ncbi:MAG: GntR family transcriptional regulator, partial [Chitinivibrionales bacterium]|nr:GntR family transcriptional regulator [Chitinivibrionales bacterium]
MCMGNDAATMTARARAERWLRLEIERCTRDGRYRLPTFVAMARASGVSVTTMSQAVRAAVTRGVLETNHKRGTTIRTLTPSPRRSTTAGRIGCAYQRIARVLERDIAQGIFTPHSLFPSCKELQERFHVSYRTAARALRQLVDRGALEPHGRTHRVRSPAAHEGRSTVVTFTRTLPPNQARSRSVELLRFVQAECRRAGIRVRTIEYGFNAPDRQSPMGVSAGYFRHLVARESVIGAMVWDMVLQPRTVRDILHQLGAFHLPVALLEEHGRYGGIVPHTSYPLRLFPLGCTADPARYTTRYLTALGHRRLGYVSPYHQAAWSRLRLEAVRAEVGRVLGDTGSVTAVLSDGPALLSPDAIYR